MYVKFTECYGPMNTLLELSLDSIFGFLNFVSIMVKQLMHLKFSDRPPAG